jgi:hypothetical protein
MDTSYPVVGVVPWLTGLMLMFFMDTSYPVVGAEAPVDYDVMLTDATTCPVPEIHLKANLFAKEAACVLFVASTSTKHLP